MCPPRSMSTYRPRLPKAALVLCAHLRVVQHVSCLTRGHQARGLRPAAADEAFDSLVVALLDSGADPHLPSPQFVCRAWETLDLRGQNMDTLG
jgi:hypothetical protein